MNINKSNIYKYSVQPQNYLAEEIILGHIIIYPYELKNISQRIHIECFFLESHKIIYKKLNEIYKTNNFSILNFIYYLQKQKILQEIGHLSKITDLIRQGQIFSSSTNTNFYIKELLEIVHDNYIKRLIIKHSYNIINLAYSNKISTKELYLKSSENLNIIYNKDDKNLDRLQDFIGYTITKLCQKTQSNILIRSISCGFQAIDKITNGLPKGDLLVIAGRPSMGKTSLVINIAYNTVIKTKTQICIFSLEMSRIQILQKLISIGSEVSIRHILQGKINKDQWEIIQKICKILIKSKIYINDNGNTTVEDISDISKLIHKKTDNNMLVIIDYLQLIQSQNLNQKNRVEELSYITRQLKILAQNLDIPIIILSQLNRNVETRSNKQPLLSDLKESGCLAYNLFLNTNNLNKISLHNNITIFRYKIPYIKSSTRINRKYDHNYIENIDFFTEHVFNYINYKKHILLITDNHPILMHSNWYLQFISQQHKNNSSYELLSNYRHIIEKNLHINITIFSYYLVYEINRNEYSNFLHFLFILHNSIEQDADIVLMLYSNNSPIQEKQNEKVIDIIISKNRNGSIGSIKLLFNLPNTKFKEINKKQLQ
uniref:replication helicase subunit n=1 Tax=Caulacanthus ustulatus TaxID=31411 RepID=UPI0027DA8FB3|nr:replication helicase subunit [Caulacanthus ustulatus]WCH57401.1 replication helicase subunit [Caulacanthus ustulatus]